MQSANDAVFRHAVSEVQLELYPLKSSEMGLNCKTELYHECSYHQNSGHNITINNNNMWQFPSEIDQQRAEQQHEQLEIEHEEKGGGVLIQHDGLV